MLNLYFGLYFGAVFGLGVFAYMEHRVDPRDAPESSDGRVEP